MKRIFTILAAVILTATLFAQAPQKMSYQAVIRDANNKLVTSHAVGMKISILQGTASGTSVYEETQTPTTNANGLVSIEIGGGSVITGNFANINWANGPYYIKTETDPTGETNYTISGTSQLLSVPYALYAQTAENGFSGNYADLANKPNLSDTSEYLKAETDPLFRASVAKGITASDTTKWSASIHKIGDSYGGGIVFYVYDGGQHGLIAATADQSTSMRWNAGTNTNTMAMADGVGAGKANTAIIIANQGNGDGATYAARICNEYNVTVNGVTYGDWYLPSKTELNLLYQQRKVVGGLASALYWNSAENDTNGAWCQVFNSSGTQNTAYKGISYYVRAIRAF